MRPLFVQLLGEAAFSTLSPRVQALHRTSGTRCYHGQADVLRGAGLLARVCGWATSLPPAAQQLSVTVEITSASQSEHWYRDFAGHPMRSRLWTDNGLLCERLGLVTLGFALAAEDGALIWRVCRVRALGLPLPACWFGGVCASESEIDGRYRFDVRARLPVAGLLVHYRGWLDVE